MHSPGCGPINRGASWKNVSILSTSGGDVASVEDLLVVFDCETIHPIVINCLPATCPIVNSIYSLS